MNIAIAEKEQFAEGFNLLRPGNEFIQPLSSALTSVEKVFNSMISTLQSGFLLKNFEHKEDVRVQKEIAAEGGLIPPDMSGVNGLIPHLDALSKILGSLNIGGSGGMGLGGLVGLAATAGLAYWAYNEFTDHDDKPEAPKTEQQNVQPSATPVNNENQSPRDLTPDETVRVPRQNAQSRPDTRQAKPASKPEEKPKTFSWGNITKTLMESPLGFPLAVGGAVGGAVSNAVGNFVSKRVNVSSEKGKNMLTIYNAYRRAGLTEEGAKTMVAQINRENSFNERYLFGTHIDDKNGKVNGGFLSWQGDRGVALMNYLRSKGLVDNNGKIKRSQEALEAQVEFSMMELRNNSQYRRSLQVLTDPKLKYQQIESVVGDNYIRWARNNPKYRESGYKNQQAGLDAINSLLQQERNKPWYGDAAPTNPAWGAQIVGGGTVPVNNMIIGDKFGMRFHPLQLKWKMHNGVDIRAATGTPVKAFRDGKIVQSSYAGGAGNMVVVDHGNGLQSRYMHLSRFTVKPGDSVTAGQVIALSGATGGVTGPHLHFEIWRNGKPVDPKPYLTAPKPRNPGAAVNSASQEVRVKRKLSNGRTVNILVQKPANSSNIIVPVPRVNNTRGPMNNSRNMYLQHF